MLSPPLHARGIARAAIATLVGLVISIGADASGTDPDSVARHATGGTPSVESKPLGGIGGGGFRVTPTRIVFEGRLRSAELTLINMGSEPATYRISLVRMRMLDNGAIEEIGDPLPGEAFADSFVRFSPRQVDLEPGATQTVRMQLRKPATLPPGEYRSHLVFRALPPVEPEDPASGVRGVRIALRPVFGAAIPVIVRHGETAANVTMGGLEVRRTADGPVLALDLRRAGNRSVYGDLTVIYTPPDGRSRNVGGMRGLAVYVPNPVRHVLVPLHTDPGEAWAAGTLRVTYEEVADEPELLAEGELRLP